MMAYHFRYAIIVFTHYTGAQAFGVMNLK